VISRKDVKELRQSDGNISLCPNPITLLTNRGGSFMSIALRWIVFTLFLCWAPLNVQAQADQVPDAPKDICPLLIGSPLPDISVKTLDDKVFDVSASVRNQPTVLIYFRGGW
jgi:hypothetical protein